MSDMVKLPGHHHPLLIETGSVKTCAECGERVNIRANYCCKICDKAWHKTCMPTTAEINHPCHPNHALKLLLDGPPHYTDGKCHFCRKKLETCFVYHCATCNLTLDFSCTKFYMNVKVDESKCHNHPLTLMARQVSFLCNVCGTHGERNPYVCPPCSFMVHEGCIQRPHVININRHDHRISHTYSLGYGNRKCKVCRLNIDWMYGAYSCLKCSEFSVHSKCATSGEVWDGMELEGVPEEEEDEPMFKVIEEGLINHVKHPLHNLRVVADGVVREERVRCQLCEGSIFADKFYSCIECDYVLHESCAYLPLKKRLGFSSSRLSLKEGFNGSYFKCEACTQLSAGTRYGTKLDLDLRCASVDWSCDHECHPHTLFLTNLKDDTCGACGEMKGYVLRCVECKFNLCYKCATYPKKIKHRCDDHPLVLSFGEKKQHGTYWCTVCETKTDPKKWFYECEECGIVCHIHCAIGDFANVKPGLFTGEDGIERGVIRNNGVTRQYCNQCATRCLVPFVYCISKNHFCSLTCLLVSNSEPFHVEYIRQGQEKLRVAVTVKNTLFRFLDTIE